MKSDRPAGAAAPAALLALLLPVLLAGCAAPPPAAPGWPPGRVACLGDDITTGRGLTNAAVQAYPAQLQTYLGPAWAVTNLGIASWSIGTARNLPKNPAYLRLQLFQPDYILLLLGFNDSHVDADLDYLRDEYRRLVQQLRALDSRPRVLVALPPCSPRDERREKRVREEITPQIRRVAEELEIPVVDLYPLLEGKAQSFPDNLYPGAMAAEAIAAEFRRALTGQLPAWRERSAQRARLMWTQKSLY